MMETIEDFDYLRDAAQKYGQLYLVHHLNGFVADATGEQLAELVSIYREIARREDSARISRWIDQCWQCDKTSDEFRFSRCVLQLLVLFRYLGEANVSPFNTKEVRYLKERPSLDWTKVPVNLGYLIDAAEKYGRLGTEADVIDFLDNKATTNDIETLAATAEQVRLNGDYAKVLEWLKQYPEDKHPEGALLYKIFLVMVHADLDFGG